MEKKNDEALIRCLMELNRIGVACYFIHRPTMLKIKCYDKQARYRMRHRISFPKIANNPQKYESIYKSILGSEYMEEDIQKLCAIPPIIKINDRYCHVDTTTEYVNVKGGIRKTENQPVNFKRKIVMYGRCGVFGYAIKDGQTLPSMLQKRLLDERYDDILVENYGLWGADTECIIENFICDVKNRLFKDGDIVVFYMHKLREEVMKSCEKAGVYFFDSTKSFHAKLESSSCFYDKPGHMSASGISNMTDIIFDFLKENDFSYKKMDINEITDEFDYSNEKEISPELFSYIQYIKSKVELSLDKQIGSIVMNCNPFTLGHRYLIEMASKKVDILLIFVLQEDKSEFSFEERFKLVKLGTNDLDNVYIFSSGKFMISSITFPEYFLKGQKQNIVVDTSNDLNLFGEIIAPNLGIKVRFVGEEPIDLVTQQYNESMKKILPQYGVQVVEIPRKTSDNEVISASVVRKLMRENRYKEIQKRVPNTTYNYLIWRKYNKIYYTLNNGVRIPSMGFGTFPLNKELLLILPKILEVGYRMIDTSDNYHNEEYIGKILKQKNLYEKNLFIITKFSKPQHIFNFSKRVDDRISLLGQGIDLLLIHWPFPCIKKSMWYEMEKIYDSGKIRGIGVCNYTIKELSKLLNECHTKPVVNQIEVHPMFQQREICQFCEKNNIRIIAYSPFARMDKRLIENEVLMNIAKKYGKSVPQIILRWDIQHGYIPIPSGKNEEHIISNLSIGDFVISENDMKLIDELDCGMRVRFNPDNRFNLREKVIFAGINVVYKIQKGITIKYKKLINEIKFHIKFYLKYR